MADVEYKRLKLGAPTFTFPITKLCTIEGCVRELRARGYCTMHWARWRKYGDPQSGAKAPPLPDFCGVDKCGRKARSRWKDGRVLCAFHYLRMMTKGTTADLKPPPPSDGRCIAEGCEEGIRSVEGQHCEKHYYRLRREELKEDPRYLNLKRAYKANRRARERGAFVEGVSRRRVMERDGWKCHLCAEPIPKEARHPEPLFGTLDHVVPLASGGKHSYANVKAAHLTCNLRKSTKPLDEFLKGR